MESDSFANKLNYVENIEFYSIYEFDDNKKERNKLAFDPEISV